MQCFTHALKQLKQACCNPPVLTTCLLCRAAVRLYATMYACTVYCNLHVWYAQESVTQVFFHGLIKPLHLPCRPSGTEVALCSVSATVRLPKFPAVCKPAPGALPTSTQSPWRLLICAASPNAIIQKLPFSSNWRSMLTAGPLIFFQILYQQVYCLFICLCASLVRCFVWVEVLT